MSRRYVDLTDHQRGLLAQQVARMDRVRKDLEAQEAALRELLVVLGGPRAGWDRKSERLYVEAEPDDGDAQDASGKPPSHKQKEGKG